MYKKGKLILLLKQDGKMHALFWAFLISADILLHSCLLGLQMSNLDPIIQSASFVQPWNGSVFAAMQNACSVHPT